MSSRQRLGTGALLASAALLMAPDVHAEPKAAPATAFVNPGVQPGKVRWHAGFAAACAAAKKSGKAVLLFQMMGRLDDRFC